MEIFFFSKGLVLGFAIAAPVGPLGVLCIRRTLAHGVMTGVLSGLGTATADGLYGAVAAFGITAVANFLLDYQWYLHLIGGVFLLYLGYTTFRALPAGNAARTDNAGFFAAYTSALFFTLTNPLTIISFVGVFAGLGVGADGSYRSAAALVLGVFGGSMLWWLVLSGAVHVLRDRVNARQLKWVNQFSGIIIATFGIMSLITLKV